MPPDVSAQILDELRAVREELTTLRALVNRDRTKYDLDAAADRLGVSRSTLYRRIDAGLVETVREGGRVFVTERACAAYEDRLRSDRP